ncbi:AAA family ATPase [Streptomyces sp. NBC_00670]|uniref:AAA family ATPase n=1 Tax=Streptomyces sp. NBC_00670 TaxID=2975804 RepID=UPI002E2F9F8E|nr:AAA family ATPase [Streptomyces sp. NBC_00670]
MTVPLTPPPPQEPSRHDQAGQQAPAPSAPAAPGPAYERWQGPDGAAVPGPFGQGPGVSYAQDGPGMKTEVREGVVVALGVAVTGVLLGVLWWWLAPHVPLVGDVVGKNWVVYLKDSEGEQAIGVDGTFTLLALAFGAVSAVVVFLARRRGGVPLVVALAVGGVLGSLLAWRVGVWLGPAQDVVAHAKSVGKGVTFSAPLKLGAKGALLAWSLAALVVHLGLTALFGPRDPEPVPAPLPPAA